jgi:hypothetical protein
MVSSMVVGSSSQFQFFVGISTLDIVILYFVMSCLNLKFRVSCKGNSVPYSIYLAIHTFEVVGIHSASILQGYCIASALA